MLLRIVNKQGMVLDLPDQVSFSIQRNNTLFNDDDKLIQDIVYQFSAPYTNNNSLFFAGGKSIETGVANYLLTDCKFYSYGSQLLSCNIRYAIRQDGYEVNLEPNLYVLKGLVDGVRMTDIPTEDADYSITTPEAMAARMLDTCVNPDKYGYIYFPVRNQGWAAGEGRGEFYPFVNYFDYTPGVFQFVTTPPAGKNPVLWAMAFSPYFKVSYILKQIAGYMGLSATGSFFTSPETKNICIYNRIADVSYEVLPCMMYMPNMLLSDFIKVIRKRLHLSIDFDLLTGEMQVERFREMARSTKAVDLTAFVGDTTEQENPNLGGYKLTLKVDTTDRMYVVPDDDGSDTFPADFTLISGDGATADEIDCGTLKETAISNPAGVIFPETDQSGYNSYFYVSGYPDDLKYDDRTDPTLYNNWPLRLIDYKGFLPVAGGQFPIARSYGFNDADIEFHKFLGDTKLLTVNNYIPASILNGLRVTNTFTHRSPELNYVRYISQQIGYDATADKKLTGTKIMGYTLDNPNITNVTIVPYTKPTELNVFGAAARVKAYFDPIKHGITQVNLQIAQTDTGDTATLPPITVPTNIKGAGGLSVSIIDYANFNHIDTELRVLQGVPKYLLHRGVRMPFEQVGDYYRVVFNIQVTAFSNLFAYYIIFF